MPLPSLPPLYPIVDEGAANLAGHTVPALAAAFIEGGARLLQIRAKLAPSGRFVEQALAVSALAHPAGALVVINDRVDVALAAGVRAVHVGQDDVTVAIVRRLLGPEGIIGLSTHTRARSTPRCTSRSTTWRSARSSTRPARIRATTPSASS